MEQRTYNQYCATARTLDIVGERWTLLLIRELLTGPKRFGDLQAGLRGLGTGLLSARLKHLERQGLVRRMTLPPPARTPAYALTQAGEELGPAVLGLARWGLKWAMEVPREEETFHPGWAVLGLRACFSPEEAAGLHAVYEFRVGAEVFHARVDDGAIETVHGPAQHPDVTITTGEEVLRDVIAGRTTLDRAARAGTASMAGDRRILGRLRTLFPLPSPQPRTPGDPSTGSPSSFLQSPVRIREGDEQVVTHADAGARRSQRERTRATTASLVAAARELFVDQGYAATSLGAICDRAGVTRGAFYHHFSNKEKIFHEVYAAEQKELAAVVRRAFRAEEDPWDGMIAGSRAMLEASLEPAVRQITLVEAPGALGRTVMRDLQAGCKDQMRSGLAIAMEAGCIPERPLEPLTSLLYGVLGESALDIFRAGDRDGMLQDTLEQLDLTLAGIAGRSGPGCAHSDQRI